MNRKPSPEFLNLLGTNIKRLRRARGQTQQDLSCSSGLGLGYIGDLERAAVNLCAASIEALCAGLDCCPVDLFRPIAPATRDSGE